MGVKILNVLEIQAVYRGYIGIMEKKMETTIVYKRCGMSQPLTDLMVVLPLASTNMYMFGLEQP